jgi:hypothetical protein
VHALSPDRREHDGRRHKTLTDIGYRFGPSSCQHSHFESVAASAPTAPTCLMRRRRR